MNNEISDEVLKSLSANGRQSVSDPSESELATELLAYREEKRKTEEVRAQSWERLPKWVRWKATDRDGMTVLYETKPIPCRGEWVSPTGAGRIIKFVGPVLGWKDTLEERP